MCVMFNILVQFFSVCMILKTPPVQSLSKPLDCKKKTQQNTSLREWCTTEEVGQRRNKDFLG